MPSFTLSSEKKGRSFLLHLVIAIAITLFLCYIDEGNYSLEWRQLLTDWPAVVLYTCIMLGGQRLVYHVLLRMNFNWKFKGIIASLIFFGLSVLLFQLFFWTIS